MCDELNDVENKNEQGYLICSENKVINIKEATYGRIDGGSKCQIINNNLPCLSSDGCNLYFYNCFQYITSC